VKLGIPIEWSVAVLASAFFGCLRSVALLAAAADVDPCTVILIKFVLMDLFIVLFT